jgi:hypothetical protein
VKYLHQVVIFLKILFRRLWQQGPLTTLHWLHGVGLPYLSGDLPLRFSRLTPNLYIGAQYGKRGRKRLEAEGINVSVNLREEFDDAAHDLHFMDYLYLPVIDNTAPTLEDLEKGVEFIQQHIAEGNKVYIHCKSGVGRAPTMVAAYLIAEGASVEDAIARITTVRPFIRVLPDQLSRLREFSDQHEQLRLSSQEQNNG